MRRFRISVCGFVATLLACSQAAALIDERLVELEAGGWQLFGTLRMPTSESPVPAVVLLHMYGRSRDDYGELAAHLARQGVASLRLDLRAHGESTNLGVLAEMTFERDGYPLDSWPDVYAAYGYLKNEPEIDATKIGFLGASYSCPLIVMATQFGAYGKAYAFLSAGRFTDEVISFFDRGAAGWWYMAARDDRPVEAESAEYVERTSENARVSIFESGGHGMQMLENHPRLAEEVAAWFATVLADTTGVPADTTSARR